MAGASDSAASSSTVFSPVRMQPLKSQIPDVPRRLIVPTSCTKCTAEPPALVTKVKTSNGKLGRPRSDSTAPSLIAAPKDNRRWFDFPCRVEIVEEDVQLSGYQIYAVEKWIVDRRANTLLVVYTGDPKDEIVATALALSASLSKDEAQREWARVMHDLRREGARPRETDQGVIMVTSLANFRSDYTVVHIPDGDFVAQREQLYVNINLMRMGCSGRSALTLQEPSDTTKDRFITMYQFSDTIRPTEEFCRTVLQLVKLIQCGLSLFELFSIELQEQNGLLCDLTVDGIQKWVMETGEPYMSLEPTERIADPSTVAALMSLVVSMRNKLNALLQGIPKDPFLQPRRFVRALAQFVNQRINQSSKAPVPASSICHHAYFNLKLIRDIDRAFEKYRFSDAYRLHRVVFNKLDDFTSATTNAMTSSAKGLRHGKSLSLSMSSKDAESLEDCTTDLAVFVNKVMSVRSKEVSQSLRYLWSGRLETLERKRMESVWSDAEEEREKEREREKTESEDDGDLLSGVLPWSNKMQKKIENWTGREFGKTRFKKQQSPDQLTSPGDEKSPEEQETPVSTGSIPRVVISGDHDEPLSGLSSGQVSPTSPSASMYALGNFSSAQGSALLATDEGLQQRLAQFNRSVAVSTNSPVGAAPHRRRTSSWADPRSADALEIDHDADMEAAQRLGLGWALGSPISAPGPALSSASQASSALSRRSSTQRGRKHQEPFFLRRKRSRSHDDCAFLEEADVLLPDQMQVDVDLCAQCWALSCRKYYVRAVIAILQALSQTTSASNEALRRHNEEYAASIKQLLVECHIVADVEQALTSADTARAETDALLYETNFFDVAGLWRQAQAPRLRVFAIRDRVFSVRGRRRVGAGVVAGMVGADGHGRFNRVQRQLDGRARLVDYLGRTESEVEEESELPEDVHMGEGDSEEEAEEEWRDASDGTGSGADPDAVGAEGEAGHLQVVSSWLLELFTKWGRVLGVGGGMAPEAAAATAAGAADGEAKEGESEGKEGKGSVPVRSRQVDGGGHLPRNRLSTVGEEDEDLSLSFISSA